MGRLIAIDSSKKVAPGGCLAHLGSGMLIGVHDRQANWQKGAFLMKRRDMLLSTGAAILGLSAFPLRSSVAANTKKTKILYFTRSAGFQYSVVTRKGDKLSHSEQILTDLGDAHAFDVTCSKDGGVFDGDLDQYDAVVFYTSGDLTQPLKGKDAKGRHEPPITETGKKRFFEYVAGGKGFVGIHAASDTWRSDNEVTEYVKLLGGQFVSHDAMQKAAMKIVSPDFPGLEGKGDSFSLLEEWYAMKNFADDLHVVLVQNTRDMKGPHYQRPPFPATWAHMFKKGRVFYTSLGHREDVWTNSLFQDILLGGLSWALKRVDTNLSPNLSSVTPKANQLTN
jgi:uncharacterized protein